jgi:Tfp pilus assembly protein PilP
MCAMQLAACLLNAILNNQLRIHGGDLAISVMGIIWGLEEPRALVRDPTGKGYFVRAGTPIGKNKGRILRIEDNKVVVKETYLDHLDRATTKEVDLELYVNGRKG